MRVRVMTLWEAARTSFWFVPGFMTVCAIGLALGLVRIDDVYSPGFLGTVARGPDGARGLLSTISASMITLAGLTFSITIVALTLASGQFGPRLIRNFMRDIANQIVLGTFVATFVYGLLVLRTVRSEEGAEFVPHLAVAVALLLAIISVGVLIYFIHHVATSIQAPHVVAAVGGDFKETIAHLFPEPFAERAPDLPVPDDGWRPLRAHAAGYLQRVDTAALIEAAEGAGGVIRLTRRPGDFISEGMVIAEISAAGATGEVEQTVNGAMVVGRIRTEGEDIEYSVRQLVEVAVRALSPGINDSFTAMGCIDWLATGLAELSRRTFPPPQRCGSDGQVRLVADVTTFDGVVRAAFDQIRQNAAPLPAVSIHLLDALGYVATQVRSDEQRAAVRHQADLIQRYAEESTASASDRADLAERFAAVLAALADPAEPR